jgi:hypothetical protein
VTTVTVRARVVEVVLGVVVVVVSRWVKGASEGKCEATGRGDVLARPGRVLARSGASWTSWARHVLGVVVLSLARAHASGCRVVR